MGNNISKYQRSADKGIVLIAYCTKKQQLHLDFPCDTDKLNIELIILRCKSTVIYTFVFNRGGKGMISFADNL